MAWRWLWIINQGWIVRLISLLLAFENKILHCLNGCHLDKTVLWQLNFITSIETYINQLLISVLICLYIMYLSALVLHHWSQKYFRGVEDKPGIAYKKVKCLSKYLYTQRLFQLSSSFFLLILFLLCFCLKLCILVNLRRSNKLVFLASVNHS